MNKKPCKLTGILLPAALTVAGTAGGWLYYRYVGCATGTCPIASNPWLTTGFGGLSGLLLGLALRPNSRVCRSTEVEEKAALSRKEADIMYRRALTFLLAAALLLSGCAAGQKEMPREMETKETEMTGQPSDMSSEESVYMDNQPLTGLSHNSTYSRLTKIVKDLQFTKVQGG